MKKILLILTVMAISGCVEPQMIHTATDLEGTVRRLIDNYRSRSADNIFSGVSRDFIGGFSEFEADVRADLSHNDQIEITYMLDGVEYTGNETRVDVRWRKKYLQRTDRDFDGMPDIWERYYGLDEDNGSDAYQDNDRDGFNNREEFLGSADPMAATSVPAGTVNTIPAPVKRELSGSTYLTFIKEEDRYLLVAQEGDILLGNSDKQEEEY